MLYCDKVSCSSYNVKTKHKIVGQKKQLLFNLFYMFRPSLPYSGRPL